MSRRDPREADRLFWLAVAMERLADTMFEGRGKSEIYYSEEADAFIINIENEWSSFNKRVPAGKAGLKGCAKKLFNQILEADVYQPDDEEDEE